MYSLRFDHGVTSAGFLLTPRGLASLTKADHADAETLWRALLARYPTIAAAFDNATPLMPLAYWPRIQHRLASATGERWASMPHTYAFVDPLFSTGIAWGLRGVERLALCFEHAIHGARVPDSEELTGYGALLEREAEQIDLLVAGAYQAMAHFDLFAAHAMLYFATVSYAEVRQRLAAHDLIAWNGFLGVGDEILQPLPRESLRRLRQITAQRGEFGTAEERRAFAEWVARAIAPRNVAGLADAVRKNLYPVDLDVLIERHALLGMSREQVISAMPALRGMSAGPPLLDESAADRSTSRPGQPSPAPETPAPR